MMCTCDAQMLPHDPVPGVCPEPDDNEELDDCE